MHFDRIFRDLSAEKDEKLTSFLRYPGCDLLRNRCHAVTFREVLSIKIENEPICLKSKETEKHCGRGGRGGRRGRGGGRGSRSKGVRDKNGLQTQSFTFSAATSQQFCRRLWLYLLLRFILHYR